VRILVVQGHPDRGARHFGHALAEAYREGAKQAGHEVHTLEVATLEFPLVASAAEWQAGATAPAIVEAQRAIAWAEHVVILFPLWLGDMPARLKGFFEQVLRPGFAIGDAPQGRMPVKLLKGRSARIVVTMGMPAFFYRLYYRSHSVKSLKRNILEFCGFSPVRVSLVGTVEGNAGARGTWLEKMRLLGASTRRL
jgi:putative NADPH-quinone reductase